MNGRVSPLSSYSVLQQIDPKQVNHKFKLIPEQQTLANRGVPQRHLTHTTQEALEHGAKGIQEDSTATGVLNAQRKDLDLKISS